MTEARPLGHFDPKADLPSLLAAIVESSNDAIISEDLSGTITSWNSAAERIFGYTASEMVGQNISLLAPPDHLDELPHLLASIRQGNKVEHFDTLRRAKNGQILDVSITLSPIRDPSGKIIGASKIARDVTSRKAADRDLASTLLRLARSNADLEQFAYAASHDLQEPLRTISAFSQLLERRLKDQLEPQSAEFLNQITTAADRMNAMIRGLLDYSRAGRALQTTSVDSRHVLDIVLGNLEKAIADSGAQITSANLPVLHTDETSLVRLLQNLIGNAVKYRDPSRTPHIHISAARDEAFWRFSVSDNGIGIDPKFHGRVFGVFKRLHGPQFPGTGIGLSLCRKIVESQGGRIWIESEAGNGATFHFTLPVQ